MNDSTAGAPPASSTSRAQSVAVVLTATAALMPTLLSADGMIGVGTDLLDLRLVVAAGLAVFLELALVSSALMARSMVQEGRSARLDVAATWAFSGLSGAISATHERPAILPGSLR